MDNLAKNILRLSRTGMFAKDIHVCFDKKNLSQGMWSVGGKFCQCQYFECTLQVITLVSFDFNSNNLPWACEELSREVERQGWESRCPWLHSIHHHTLALAAEDSNKQAGCRSILIVRSTPGEGLAISMCLQYGTLPRWLFAVSVLPEYCTIFHFPVRSSVRPSHACHLNFFRLFDGLNHENHIFSECIQTDHPDHSDHLDHLDHLTTRPL